MTGTLSEHGQTAALKLRAAARILIDGWLGRVDPDQAADWAILIADHAAADARSIR